MTQDVSTGEHGRYQLEWWLMAVYDQGSERFQYDN